MEKNKIQWHGTHKIDRLHRVPMFSNVSYADIVKGTIHRVCGKPDATCYVNVKPCLTEEYQKKKQLPNSPSPHYKRANNTGSSTGVSVECVTNTCEGLQKVEVKC